jgi:hypothetical protein
MFDDQENQTTLSPNPPEVDDDMIVVMPKVSLYVQYHCFLLAG